MILKTLDDVRMATAGLVSGNADATDRLAWTGVFGTGEVQLAARAAVLEQAQSCGVYPASIHGLYTARGRGETPTDFTVPAINIRGISYDTARALFRARKALDAGAVICEIARSEISYTGQRPSEYVHVILCAAMREGWRGPVFIQGDHFQISAARFSADPQGELNTVRELTAEAIAAGFHNIDVDTSTLVDLSPRSLEEQQQANGRYCAELTAFIREHEPEGVTVSVGGEIGEVGGKNSTPEELHAFMKVYQRELDKLAPGAAGMSKISIQTGTSHGGVPLPDGSIAAVKIDFDAIDTLSRIAREQYGMAGAVQHGASTLPAELFDRFPALAACEIHLATEFQNMIFDNPGFPADLKSRIYTWLDENAAGERKPSDTDEQFHYKTRKKALGEFKLELWSMAPEARESITKALEEKFTFLLSKLRVNGTRELAQTHAPFVPASFPRAATEVGAGRSAEDTTGLSD